LGNFFKLNDSRRKGFSLGRKRQNGRPNRVPPRIRGLNYHKKTTSFGKITFFEEKGTKLPLGVTSLREQVIKCLTRKYKG
jgi:hypothetical protein